MAVIKRWLAIATKQEYFRPVRDVYTSRRPLLLHSHDYAEITWIDRGRARHRINGREDRVEPGSLMVIRATDCHELIPFDSETVELTNIAFPLAVLDSLRVRYLEAMREIVCFGKKFGFTAQLETPQRARINKWADELFFSSRRERLPIDRFVLNLVTLLLEQKRVETPTEAPDWLVRAWIGIQQLENFSRGPMAFFKMARCSREHAGRELKRHFGVTPGECVQQARITYAARLLEMTTRPILEIALDCGYRDLAHFYKAFRSIKGTTPRAYRVRNRI